MRTVGEIIEDAKGRYDARTRTNGLLARHDIQDFLATLPVDMPRETKLGELTKFLDNFPFVDEKGRSMLWNDLTSYGL